MTHVQTTGFQPLATTLRGHGHGHDRALQRTLRDSVAVALNIDGRGRGIHGLALAIRDKLAKSEAGTDAALSVLETINRALDDAAAKLAAQGVSRDEIDQGIERFRGKLAREIGELAGAGRPAADKPDPGNPVTTEKSAIAARSVVRERFSLDVLTAEGDRVSIRFKSLSVTEAAAAKVSNENGTATTAQASVISRGRFKVEVDGDLNEAERAAIGHLLDEVDDIAMDFFGGDVQAAFAAAARVGLDSSALSAFDLRLSYLRSMAAVQTYSSNAKLVDQKPVEPASPPAAAQPPASTQPPALAQPITKAPVITDPVAAPSVNTSPEVAAPAVEGTATTAASAHNTAKAVSAIEMITSFAKDVLERLDKDDESDAVKFSLRWKVEFMVKAFGSVALTQAEQKAADALGIALGGQNPGA